MKRGLRAPPDSAGGLTRESPNGESRQAPREPLSELQHAIGNRAFVRLVRGERSLARQPTTHAPAKAPPEVESWESHIVKGFQVSGRDRLGNPPTLYAGDSLVVRARFRELDKAGHDHIGTAVTGASALVEEGWEDDRTYRWTFRFDHAGPQRIGFDITSGGKTIDDYEERFRVVGRSISAQDIETIVLGHLRFWHEQTHNGLVAAELKEGDEDSRKWFYVSLAGNLLWAATAFIDPAAYAEAKVAQQLHLFDMDREAAKAAAEKVAKQAIKWMSVSGATIGSNAAGEAAKLFRTDSPVSSFKDLAIHDLSLRYKALNDDLELREGVWRAFEARGLVDADDSSQSQARENVAWDVMFKVGTPKQPEEIESLSRVTIEAIWRDYYRRVKDYDDFWETDTEYHDKDAYYRTAYYQALVTSGAIKQYRDVSVRHETKTVRGMGRRIHFVSYAAYQLPGGLEVDVLEKPDTLEEELHYLPFEWTYERIHERKRAKR